jgi:hypothetical protein
MAVSLYSPNQQTKQQLEELESLLQRMLTSPTNGQEPPLAMPAMPAPSISPSPPSLPSASQSVIGGEPTLQVWRVQTPMSEPGAGTFTEQQPPLATPVDPIPPEPRFFAGSRSPTAANAPPSPFPYQMVFGPQTASAAPAIHAVPVAGIPVPQWEASKSSADLGPLPVALWPVYVLNKAFDLLTFPLGPLGSWLRQPGGRNTLGWLGLLMILGAIGWAVADWYGMDWIR